MILLWRLGLAGGKLEKSFHPSQYSLTTEIVFQINTDLSGEQWFDSFPTIVYHSTNVLFLIDDILVVADVWRNYWDLCHQLNLASLRESKAKLPNIFVLHYYF